MQLIIIQGLVPYFSGLESGFELNLTVTYHLVLLCYPGFCFGFVFYPVSHSDIEGFCVRFELKRNVV